MATPELTDQALFQPELVPEIRAALDYLAQHNKRFLLLTWGDDDPQAIAAIVSNSHPAPLLSMLEQTAEVVRKNLVRAGEQLQ